MNSAHARNRSWKWWDRQGHGLLNSFLSSIYRRDSQQDGESHDTHQCYSEVESWVGTNVILHIKQLTAAYICCKFL